MIVNGVFPWTRNIAEAAGPLRWDRVRARESGPPKRRKIRIRRRRRAGYRNRDVPRIEDWCLLFVLHVFVAAIFVFLAGCVVSLWL